jgi:hypothetical protein
MRWAAHVAYLGAMGNACRIFIGKPEEKRPVGRPKLTWEGGIKFYLRKI